MKTLLAIVVVLLSIVGTARADECPAGSTCVPPEDMQTFVQLLRDQKCRSEQVPVLKMDPVTIIVDRQGRVYYSGSEPLPYKVHVDWCNYHVEAVGKVSVQVAQRVEPTWGWRFRMKAAFAYLPLEAVLEKDATQGLDGGVLLEPFFLQSFNVNAYVGVRSVGAGVGLDLTKNFGLYAGYALALGSWRSNPHFGVSFSFW
jgi:hypothetical protein